MRKVCLNFKNLINIINYLNPLIPNIYYSVRIGCRSSRQSKSHLSTDKFRYIFTKGVAGVMFNRDKK